ncbi:MAG: hypothetical protein HY744_13355 [Deltaproteobacteria bacterium]|nr:hypothetical protein [Deltaproteobacteria bacterium]
MLALLAPSLPGCNGLAAFPAASCGELGGGDLSVLEIEGQAEISRRGKAFAAAARELDALALRLEVSLIASCRELGLALDMDAGSVTAAPDGGEGAKDVCEAVADRARGILSANKDAKLSVEILAPKCYADLDAFGRCLGECGSALSRAEIEVSCKGAAILGTCEAECQGACTLPPGAACKGRCNGKCDGSCNGTAAEGKSASKCEGSCEGRCSGTCEVMGQPKCEGRCAGGCSAELKAPKCSGKLKPSKVEPGCLIGCTGRGAASVACDPPGVLVTAGGKLDESVTKLASALETALPKIAEIQLGRARSAQAAAADVVAAGAELQDLVRKLEPGPKALKAGICVADAVGLAGSAWASLGVSVNAGASVSAAVGGR